MGKSTISMAMFNSYLCLPEGISTIPYYTPLAVPEVDIVHHSSRGPISQPPEGSCALFGLQVCPFSRGKKTHGNSQFVFTSGGSGRKWAMKWEKDRTYVWLLEGTYITKYPTVHYVHPVSAGLSPPMLIWRKHVCWSTAVCQPVSCWFTSGEIILCIYNYIYIIIYIYV